MTWLYVAMFGAVGVSIRYMIVHLFPLTTFPWAVLFLNIAGSGMGGVLLSSPYLSSRFSEKVLTALAIGLLGGLTTYSTFAMDTVRLLKSDISLAMVNLLLSNVLCVLACFAGYKWGEHI